MFTLSLEGNLNCLCLRGRAGSNLRILIASLDSSRRSVFDWGNRNTGLEHVKKKKKIKRQFSGRQIHAKTT